MKKYLVSTATLLASVSIMGCGGNHHHKQAPAPPPAPQKQQVYHTAFGPSPHPPGWGATPKGFTAPRPVPATVPTIEMYDTITLDTVPHGAPVLAGYTSGFWPTYVPLTQLSWHPIVKSIAVTARYHAMCLDVEPGDATPAQAAGWVRADIAAGFAKPCLYSSISYWHDYIFPALNSAGIPRSAYWAWDAWYTFHQHLDSGFDATQWTDRAFNSNLDESTDTLAFAGINPTPAKLKCFGPHAQLNNATCKKVRSQVSSWSRMRNASQREYQKRGCVVLAQRVGYFRRALVTHPRSSQTARWRGALASSRTSYRRNSCGVFAGRVNYANHQIQHTLATY